MRIPVTKNDWPKSFNSTAKYIGKRWPSGPIKLSAAQECLSVLMGYHSVRDLRQELVDDIKLPGKHYDVRFDTNCMAGAMALKAILKYNQPPLESFRLFNSIPWANLDVWKHTRQHENKTLDSKLTKGHQINVFRMNDVDDWIYNLDFDDVHGTESTRAELLHHARHNESVPKAYVAWHEDGRIYLRSAFQFLLESLAPTDVDKGLLQFGLKEYFDCYLAPLAFLPVETMITLKSASNPVEWFLPDNVHVTKTSNDCYALIHTELNAFYPGEYSKEKLLEVIDALYRGELIPSATGAPPVEVCIEDESIRLYQNDIDVVKVHSVEVVGANGIITLNGQLLYPRHRISNYEKHADNPFLELMAQDQSSRVNLSALEKVFPTSEVRAISMAFELINNSVNEYPDPNFKVIDLEFDKLSGKTLSKLHQLASGIDRPITLTIEDMVCDSKGINEDLPEILEYRSYCLSLGEQIISHLPYLSLFGETEYLGYRYIVEQGAIVLNAEDLSKESYRLDELDMVVTTEKCEALVLSMLAYSIAERYKPKKSTFSIYLCVASYVIWGAHTIMCEEYALECVEGLYEVMYALEDDYSTLVSMHRFLKRHD